MSVLLASEEQPRTSASLATSLPAQNDRIRSVDRWLRNLFLRQLQGLRHGQLTLVDPDGEHAVGDEAAGLSATVNVHDAKLYRSLMTGGAMAAAESYLDGVWDCDDLTTMMRILAKQSDVMESVDTAWSRAVRPFRRLLNAVNRNTRSGSRRNIAAHYDLSNDFFSLWLDPTMTYSAGVFERDDATMEEASIAKYDRIAQKLELTSEDHVVEVGCGWGGFAVHAAETYGCRVTATTISQQQFELACKRVRERGLQDRVRVVKQDYRDLQGEYDKLVSIEMIEAVGERYLAQYFRQCARLLKPDGLMTIQAITMPDYRYDDYRSSVDFIQRYIFPGGFLPSIAKIAQCLRQGTILQWAHMDELTLGYAETLARWRTEFWNQIDSVRGLGFDERFIRTWHYYLCYCEAGFRERQIAVHQLTLRKPRHG